MKQGISFEMKDVVNHYQLIKVINSVNQVFL